MARIVIDCKEKTKDRIASMARKMKLTLKKFILQAIGTVDE